MRSSKISYVLVGSFVLAMLAGLLASLALLSGRTGATDPYYAMYRNVTGVKFGTQVLYEGYPIGQVEDVKPVPEAGGMRFRVDFNVVKGWRIPQDSAVQIAAPGLLSAITLMISAGSSERSLKPGGQVAAQERTDVLQVLSGLAANVNDVGEKAVKPLLANIDKAVTRINQFMEEGGKAEALYDEFRLALRNGNSLISDLREMADRIPPVIDNINDFATELKAAGKEFGALLTAENRTQLENLVNNMDEASANLDLLVRTVNDLVQDNREKINKSVADVEHVTDSVARHIDSVNRNLDDAARNMSEFTRLIRQNPGLLLAGKPPSDEAQAQ